MEEFGRNNVELLLSQSFTRTHSLAGTEWEDEIFVVVRQPLLGAPSQPPPRPAGWQSAWLRPRGFPGAQQQLTAAPRSAGAGAAHPHWRRRATNTSRFQRRSVVDMWRNLQVIIKLKYICVSIAIHCDYAVALFG